MVLLLSGRYFSFPPMFYIIGVCAKFSFEATVSKDSDTPHTFNWVI
jgi:hypothetical protein